jgi:hypothetical protein
MSDLFPRMKIFLPNSKIFHFIITITYSRTWKMNMKKYANVVTTSLHPMWFMILIYSWVYNDGSIIKNTLSPYMTNYKPFKSNHKYIWINSDVFIETYKNLKQLLVLPSYMWISLTILACNHMHWMKLVLCPHPTSIPAFVGSKTWKLPKYNIPKYYINIYIY